MDKATEFRAIIEDYRRSIHRASYHIKDTGETVTRLPDQDGIDELWERWSTYFLDVPPPKWPRIKTEKDELKALNSLLRKLDKRFGPVAPRNLTLEQELACLWGAVGCETLGQGQASAPQPDPMAPQNKTSRDATASPAAPADTIIAMGNRQYRLNNGEPRTVTPRQDAVLQAFLVPSPITTMDKPTLERRSRLDDAVSVLRGLREIFGGAVSLPGGRGKGGYRVHIRLAE